MSGALRTQIYLTREQRKRLDEIAAGENTTLAAVIRQAVDEFLGRHQVDIQAHLDKFFGAEPDFSIPSRKELWGDRGARFGRL